MAVPESSRTPVLAYPLGDALYLNLTSACTLACTFCPKIRDDDWVVGGFDLKLDRAIPRRTRSGRRSAARARRGARRWSSPGSASRPAGWTCSST